MREVYDAYPLVHKQKGDVVWYLSDASAFPWDVAYFGPCSTILFSTFHNGAIKCALIITIN